MCDPVSLIAVGTAATVASTAVQGVSSYQTHSANADLRRAEATRARQMTALNETTFNRDVQKKLRQQVVDQIAAGSSPSTGTSLDQAFFSARNADLDRQRIRLRGEEQARSLEQRAEFEDASATNALIGIPFAAGASLLRGGRQLRALE